MTTPQSLWMVPATLCVLASYGCSAVDVRSDVERVEIASTVFFTLPEVEDITESFDATQLLVAEYDESTYSFQVQLEFRPELITIAAVTLWGSTLFSITYDGAALRTQGLLNARGLNAEYLLADVLLAFWDPDWLSERLEGGVLEVSQDTGSRTISRGGAAVIEISYETADPWAGRTHFTHVERGYILDIHTVERTGP